MIVLLEYMDIFNLNDGAQKGSEYKKEIRH